MIQIWGFILLVFEFSSSPDFQITFLSLLYLQVLPPSVACAVSTGVVRSMRIQDLAWLSPLHMSLDISMFRRKSSRLSQNVMSFWKGQPNCLYAVCGCSLC